MSITDTVGEHGLAGHISKMESICCFLVKLIDDWKPPNVIKDMHFGVLCTFQLALWYLMYA